MSTEEMTAFRLAPISRTAWRAVLRLNALQDLEGSRQPAWSNWAAAIGAWSEMGG